MAEPDHELGGRKGDAFWAGLALPGVVWLSSFLPRSVLRDPLRRARQGGSDPPKAAGGIRSQWDTAAFEFVFEGLFTSGAGFGKVFLRTVVYVVVASACRSHRVPVAYFVARYGGRWKGLLLLGLLAPFFISYLMRMLAWMNLLQDDGWVNDVLSGSESSTSRATGSTGVRRR